MTGTIAGSRSSRAMDVWAGSVAAVVLYAEYLGLSSTLTSALPAEGSGQSLALVLILVAVACACVCSAVAGTALIAGPRAASLSVLAVATLHLSRKLEVGTEQLALCVGLITLTAAAVHGVGQHPACIGAVRRAPGWLREGFFLGTAATIVAGHGVAGMLRGCSRYYETAA